MSQSEYSKLRMETAGSLQNLVTTGLDGIIYRSRRIFIDKDVRGSLSLLRRFDLVHIPLTLNTKTN